MRILFLGTNLSVPTNNGQSIRTMSLIRSLAAAGHELHFHTLVQTVRPESLHPLDKYCRHVEVIDGHFSDTSILRQYTARLACLLQQRSYAIERFKCTRLRKSVESALASEPFDLLVVDSIYGFSNLPKTDIPVFLNCHNAEFRILERYADQVKNWAVKLYAKLESSSVRREEQKAFVEVDHALVCSNDDARILAAFNPKIPITVVPNTVDVDLYTPHYEESASATSSTILFQGGMDWYPNRDAVEYFAFQILPLIRQSIPAAKFVIAGRNPSARFVEQFSSLPQVQFTGTVPDLRPYLDAAAVSVVPLRVGGGTRIKILESCAAGKAIVSTTLGAEGLELKPNTEILIADDPQTFANEVVALINDRQRRNQIGRAARSAVEARYSTRALEQSLAIALSCLGEKRRDAVSADSRLR